MELTVEPLGDLGAGARVVDFDEWVAARGDALFRLAFVITGTRADAEDAVQDALSRALSRWDRILQADDPDAYVRRMVINAHTSWWRTFRKRESPVAEVSPGHTDGPDVEEHGGWDGSLAGGAPLPDPLRTD